MSIQRMKQQPKSKQRRSKRECDSAIDRDFTLRRKEKRRYIFQDPQIHNVQFMAQKPFL
jgi:hypothetical protein